MNIDLTRRGFLGLAASGAVVTTLGALGFGAAEAAEAAHVRAFKLTTATETRNICTYCSVACGIIMYSKGDYKAGEKADLIHIEGDADHPTNRGTLCPKGAALKDYVKAETRLTRPRRRAPGHQRKRRRTRKPAGLRGSHVQHGPLAGPRLRRIRSRLDALALARMREARADPFSASGFGLVWQGWRAARGTPA